MNTVCVKTEQTDLAAIIKPLTCIFKITYQYKSISIKILHIKNYLNIKYINLPINSFFLINILINYLFFQKKVKCYSF